ncbi:hypothetical protein [Streptomyces sp. AA1529]|uniref:hypothetical protein n=1 Tax=Streptomyces sp. AA1529 TaxID=1203257 RepID=UPI000300B9BA|nr:hypothetical protein [Streptomyces sp. AA1529]
MTRLSPAERLAATDRDTTLADITNRTSDWDRFLVEQAIFCLGLANDEFSANSMRDLLPKLAHGHLGAAFNALRSSGVIEHTGQYVPSTSPTTHGHPVAVWRLSIKGHLIAAQRRPRQQGSAAA